MAELRLDQVAVRFGGIQALNNVDLTVSGGRVHGLIGPNGAGKTTLFNVVTGLQPPTRGRVRLDGRDITRAKPHKRARAGMARTFQRIELFGTLTARENVQMAAETCRRRGALRRPGARRDAGAGHSPESEADALLERVGLREVAHEPTDMLPTGLARLVELARALATAPSLLLLDEPSAGLNQAETSELGRVLVDLAGEGMAVLLVEHDMSLVMGISHDVTVLHFGEVIAAGDPALVQADPNVQAAYLGGEARHHAPRPSGSGSAGHRVKAGRERAAAGASGGTTPVGAPAMLEFADVRAAYGRIEVVHGVSLAVPAGSVFALLGPNGAGKSTLLKVACGRLAATAGDVLVDGRSIVGRSPESLARRGVCAIPEGCAVFPNLTVAENLLMYTYRGRGARRSDIEEKSYARFPLLGERRRQLAGRLSGGEQQMLALARALYTDPHVLLLDEISMGLAPLVVTELYDLVDQLVEQEHLTILVVEQFAKTALGIADHVAVMVHGEIVRSGRPADVADDLMGTYMGASH